MTQSNRTKAALAAVIFALPPTVAVAAPTTMLEKSATYAFGNEVRAFRVPTTDSAGKIKYNDVVIKLTVGATGVIATTAKVTATGSPNPPTSVNIVPGSYKASDGTICTATNFTLTSGRVQTNFLCITPVARNWEFSVVTGPISDGHTYLSQLVTAGVDKLADAATYSWGIGTTGNGRVAACEYFDDGYVVGAKSNGNQLVLSAFYYRSPAAFRCGGTMVKE
ncbi:MAG: hypothetical protein WAS21_32160 [Geminicoccaceae bacterium]